MDPSRLKFDYADPTKKFEPVTEAILRILTQELQAQIFQGKVFPGQVYEVTGSGPFPEDALIDLVSKFGLYFLPEHFETDREQFQSYYVVVGREAFDENFLESLLDENDMEQEERYIFLSQEAFLNYWLFGIETRYVPGDPRIDEHPGLRFLSSVGMEIWPWPSTELFPITLVNGDVETGTWRTKHILKQRFGYSVAKNAGLSAPQRQRILDTALTTRDNPLELKAVAEHLAWLARMNKRRRDARYAEAIAKWEEDLAYLKSKYYRHQFSWPRT